ncbi:MAG: hypothetical protein ACR2GB_05820, partial [Nocardioidaceae bacterium]
MEWLVVALLVFGLFVLLRSSGQGRLQQQGRRGLGRQSSSEELAAVKHAADEDVTEFGEELQRLDLDLAGHALDEATRQDYQRALDDYEAAKQSVDAVSSPDEVRHVAEILEDGRYAVACVRARAAGE